MISQGLALSPYLFALLIDGLIKYIQDDIPWCMFANNIVLIDETKNGVNDKLEKWWETLEVKGFKMTRCKMEYMECNFKGKKQQGQS